MNEMFKKWFESYKREIVVGVSVALSVGFISLISSSSLKTEIRELQTKNEEQQSKISSLEMTEKSLRNDKKYLQEKVDSAIASIIYSNLNGVVADSDLITSVAGLEDVELSYTVNKFLCVLRRMFFAPAFLNYRRICNIGK